jgi:chemotaxis protein histidine kinase CheA
MVRVVPVPGARYPVPGLGGGMDAEFADLVPLFVSETRARLERLATLAPRVEGDPAAAAEARRELHTIKGAGRMLGLPAISDLCHRAEGSLQLPEAGASAAMTAVVDSLTALVDEVASGAAEPPPGPAADAAATPAASQPDSTRPAVTGAEIRLDTGTLDALADRATRLRILAAGAGHFVDRLRALVRLAEEGAGHPHPEQILQGLAAALRRATAELDEGQRRLRRTAESQVEKLQALQVQPLRPFLHSLARHARTLAQSLDREVEVSIAGEETRLDRGIAAEIEEALLHLVRNAVDHGVEPPEARRARGKPPRGQIRIEASARGVRVRLEIADDGGGIDRAAVIERAVASGLVAGSRAAELTDEEVHRLLLVAGFSTRREVSEVSGRGIGLDVVATAMAAIGGDLAISSRPDEGTTVAVEVPAARRGEDISVLRVGRLRVGLPASAIRRVTQIAAGDVVEHNGRSLARVGHRLVRFTPLAVECGEVPAARQLLIEGVAAGHPIAVAVDAIDGQEEVLLRPLTRLAPAGTMLEGVTLLSSGAPMAILSPLALAQAGDRRQPPAVPTPRTASPLRVLLVDDSMVTREMERRLLEDAGFLVSVAAEGSEALSQLGAERFDCVVTDLEMPGMDGYELTRRLRSVPKLSQIPVVVVSTRDRPGDRLRGLAAGADAYLTKQRLDPGELAGLIRRLGGRR